MLVTLNRPEAMNALLHDMGGLLRDAINTATTDSDIGAVVITGAGRGFCSGGDIALMEQVISAGGRWEKNSMLVRS